MELQFGLLTLEDFLVDYNVLEVLVLCPATHSPVFLGSFYCGGAGS